MIDPTTITPGFLTSSGADTLRETIQLALDNSDAIDNGVFGWTEQFPAKITAYDSTTERYSWTERQYTPAGLRTDRLNGRTGSATNAPAYASGSGAAPSVFPVDVWMRKRLETSVGPVYEFDWQDVQAGSSGAGEGWAAGLISTDCLYVSSDGATGFYLSSSDGLTWSNSGTNLTICSADYEVEFTKGTCNGPCLTLTTTTGSSTTYTGTRAASGCTYAEFSFSKRSLCPATTRSALGPCYDTVTVRVDWSCCPITDWDGEGWYCVTTAAGSCADAIALNLTDDDKCDTDIQICSGPYANQAAAEAVCGAVTTITITCGATDYDIPSVVYAKCLDSIAGLGTVKLTWDGVSLWTALSLPSGCGVLTSMTWNPCGDFILSGATFNFSFFNPLTFGCSSFPGFCGFTESPLRWAGVGGLSGTCSGTGRVEITATP